jgi:hypothetical protein
LDDASASGTTSESSIAAEPYCGSFGLTRGTIRRPPTRDAVYGCLLARWYRLQKSQR